MCTLDVCVCLFVIRCVYSVLNPLSQNGEWWRLLVLYLYLNGVVSESCSKKLTFGILQNLSLSSSVKKNPTFGILENLSLSSSVKKTLLLGSLKKLSLSF
jgi:hypothetical protein